MKKLFLLSVLLPALTACGGGGGGSSTPTAPPIGVFNAQIVNLPTSMSESTTATFSVSFENIKTAASATVSVDVPDAVITPVTGSANTYMIAISELQTDRTYTIQLRANDGSDGTRTVSRDYTLKGVNASFQAELKEIQFVLAQSERLTQMTQEKNVIANIKNLIAVKSPSYTFIDDGTEIDSDDSVKSSLLALSEQVALYEQGAVSDSVVSGYFGSTNAIINLRSDSYSKKLNAYLTGLRTVMPNVGSVGELRLDSALNVVSYFEGNPAFGEYQNGQWVYAPNSAFIPELFKAPCFL